ncbi:hypothetical protein AAG570_001536 [Ranatra chinensis]|uniref:Uncharacterized protein n=1 Tax=Ranatra chinensis TaxID=642074 RepID=A0ABD0YRE4_9HEMI
MNKRLALELLQKVSNPTNSFTELEADDDGAIPNVPQRIESRMTGRAKVRDPSLVPGDGETSPCPGSSFADIPRPWDIMGINHVINNTEVTDTLRFPIADLISCCNHSPTESGLTV